MNVVSLRDGTTVHSRNEQYIIEGVSLRVQQEDIDERHEQAWSQQ